MGVDDIRNEGWDGAEADVGRHAGERSKTQPVVGPIKTCGRKIRVAAACKQMRRVEDKQIELAASSAQQPRFTAKREDGAWLLLQLAQRVQDFRGAGHERAHFDGLS